MDSKKVIKKMTKHGMGLFAKSNISRGEIIAEFDGQIYHAPDHMLPADPPLYACDHSIHFSEDKFRDSKGFARLINHTCNPNCGVRGLFKIVTMRDIKKGEELTWDYAMTEDNGWKMKCGCGLPECRKKIVGYSGLSPELRYKYRNYTSKWLIKKYGKPKNPDANKK